MLTNIITNPIDTPYGYKNPVHGIALRGPLSQFFSGIYLKPLDDAFDNTMVTYIRFQDDLLILCKTKRQMQRAKRRMMEALNERRLTWSRKKSCMGSIDKGFHFFSRWLHWWVNASNTWQYHELLQSFMNVCWDESVSAYAAALYHLHPTSLRTMTAFDAGAATAA